MPIEHPPPSKPSVALKPRAKWGYMGLLAGVAAAAWYIAVRPNNPKVLISPSGSAIASKLTTEAYVWKRQWTPSLPQVVGEMGPHLDSIVVLAAEIDRWPTKTQPAEIVRPNIHWSALLSFPGRVGLAVRAPSHLQSGKNSEARLLCLQTVVNAVLLDASAHDVTVSELQIDFDCPQSGLSGYANWLENLRPSLNQDTDLTITALPSWLDESAWQDVVAMTDSFVLQVHSVDIGTANAAPVLCDADRSLRWAKKANQAGVPFRVALPTYNSAAGFSEKGDLMGIVSDGPIPNWPPGTSVRFFRSEPSEMATLNLALRQLALAHLTGIIWYRLGDQTEGRNWTSATLTKVIQAREPESKPDVVFRMGEIIDLELDYSATLPGRLPPSILIRWNEAAHLIAGDGIGGYRFHVDGQTACFQLNEDLLQSSAVQEGRRNFGWLRFSIPNPKIHVEVRD